jgi:hypothetical protein
MENEKTGGMEKVTLGGDPVHSYSSYYVVLTLSL